MSKKVTFKRPKKPAPEEADDWVRAEPAKRKARAVRKTGKPSPAAKAGPPEQAAPGTVRPSVEQLSLLNELRWVRQLMGSVARQVELISDRADRRALAGRLGAQPTPEQLELQREIAAQSTRVVEQVSAFRKLLDDAAP